MNNLPYKRADRVSQMIHRVLADALTMEMSDPGLSGVTIMSVKLTADMGIARVYYAFNPYSDVRKKEIDKAWGRAASYLRRLVGSEVKLRITPKLEFFHDEGLDMEEKIEKLLHGGE